MSEIVYYESPHTGQEIDSAIAWLLAHAHDMLFGGVLTAGTLTTPDHPTYWFAKDGTYTGAYSCTIGEGYMGIICYNGYEWSLTTYVTSADVTRIAAAESAISALQTNKANITDVEAALALKVDLTDVEAALALKADVTDVEAALALKASATDMSSAQTGIADLQDRMTAAESAISGMSGENVAYDNTHTYLITDTVQGAIDDLAVTVKGDATVYDTRQLPRATDGYYDEDGTVIIDNKTSHYNKVNLDYYAGNYIQIDHTDASSTSESYVLLYASDGTTIRERHILNKTNKHVEFTKSIASGDKLALSCSKNSVPVIKFLGAKSIIARILRLEKEVFNVLIE